jgi:hypothetical protein
MDYEFIYLKMFLAKAEKLHLSMEDFRLIELEIMMDPKGWPVIGGSGGLRKMRFAPHTRSGGKSGGLRVCYFVIDAAGQIYLLSVFAKNSQSNMDSSEISDIARVIGLIKKEKK